MAALVAAADAVAFSAKLRVAPTERAVLALALAESVRFLAGPLPELALEDTVSVRAFV